MGVLKNTNAKVLKRWEIKQQQGEVISYQAITISSEKVTISCKIGFLLKDY